MTLARRERFDLLILESHYPDSQGANLCRQIRAFDSETPILFFPVTPTTMTSQPVWLPARKGI
jgi:DNA-binding response OmpR family regulator